VASGVAGTGTGTGAGVSDGEMDIPGFSPVVELLERERLAWQEERAKLIQCIHLQQIQAHQQSLAAHERATDIAKVLYCQ
jgi:hypothetical protein